MSSPSKRRDMDIMKLMMSEFAVTVADDASEFYVKFAGPADSPYDKGTWKVRVTLPKEYPYKSPSIGFCNTIFHPNVDEASGSVCLDVINSKWSPMFDLVNIFSVFLPQLLLYPNPADPLNGEAAAMLLQDKDKYNKRVSDYVLKYAQEANLEELEKEESESEKELSDIDDAPPEEDNVGAEEELNMDL